MTRFYLFLLFPMLMACEEHQLSLKSNCFKGTVIPQECVGSTLISIEIADGIKGAELNDFFGKDYKNVVKAPGNFPPGTFYFQFREFDESKDSTLFAHEICKMIRRPVSVPVVVVKNYSPEACPSNEKH